MRITAITTWFPTQSATQRGSFVVRDLHAIARLHDVRLVHLVSPGDDDGTRRLQYEGIEILRIPMNPRDPRSLVRAAHQLGPALAGAQLVHTMAFSALLPFTLPPFVGRIAQPWVHTEHWSVLTAPETLPRLTQPLLPAVTRLLRRPDLVTVACEPLAAPIRAVRGEKPVRLVPCIVEPFTPTARRDRTDGALRLVSTGGLIDRKDPLLAVETVAELVRRGVDAHLTWVGEGPLREAVETRAAAPDLAGRITLTGTLDQAGVRAQLAAADLFIAPTKGDNFFVALAEAVMAGRPCLVSQAGARGEYLTETSGRLLASRCPQDWADAVVEFDAASRDTSADEISATIGEAFSSAQVAGGYNAAYRAAIAGRTRA